MEAIQIKPYYGAEKAIISSRSKRILLPHMPIQFFAESAQRAGVEQFIKDSFAHHYQARVNYFLPNLLATICDGKYTGAIGFQVAENNRLFLEQYLPSSIEAEIKRLTRQHVDRKNIVEIGNLTSVHPGTSHLLFVLVIAILAASGVEWSVFTATRQVRKILQRLGIKTFSLCEAKPELLADKGKSWGSYYKNRPSVTIGNLFKAKELLQQHPVTAFMLQNYQQEITEIARKIRG